MRVRERSLPGCVSHLERRRTAHRAAVSGPTSGGGIRPVISTYSLLVLAGAFAFTADAAFQSNGGRRTAANKNLELFKEA